MFGWPKNPKAPDPNAVRIAAFQLIYFKFVSRIYKAIKKDEQDTYRIELIPTTVTGFSK